MHYKQVPHVYCLGPSKLSKTVGMLSCYVSHGETEARGGAEKRPGRGRTGPHPCHSASSHPPSRALAPAADTTRSLGSGWRGRTKLFASLGDGARDEPPELLPNTTNLSEVLRAGGRGGWRRPGLSFGVAMAARSSFQTWLYQQSSDGSACDRLKPRG